LYRTYIDQMTYAEQCGFDWVGCNEHHFSPYGLMANCNLIGSILSQQTKKLRLAMCVFLIFELPSGADNTRPAAAVPVVYHVASHKVRRVWRTRHVR